ncbi:MAG: Rpn family recombination-promoting nuclease/putative transposase [Prevotellaceae bacterium]|jgi:predicted transposase/invertase (TIGR01784 family)|nr:Rpn family recombination-promoting nuclease/putative transposase [Prevotellaceae bacterium]
MESIEDNKSDETEKKERPLVSFDWAIKRILRDKTNFEIVEGFISELLRREIKITNVLESESNKTHSKDKHNRVDIVVEDTKGEVILIEIQFIPEIDYFHRMLYGVGKAIFERMTHGDQYMKIKKIYSINIVYFDLGKGKGYVYHGKTDFKNVYDDNDILELSETQRNIFGRVTVGDLYPEYYVLKINKFNNIAKNTLDEWIYFLKNDKVQDNFKAKGLFKAREILDYNRLSPAEKSVYDRNQENKSRYRSDIATAKQEGELEMKKIYSKALEEHQKTLEEKDKALEEKDKALEEHQKALEEKDKALEEHQKALEEKDKALEKQRKAFEEQQRSLEEQRKAFEEQQKSLEEQWKENAKLREQLLSRDKQVE